jgi:hypothetical protein
VLHPDGSVRDFWAALQPRHDPLYDTLRPFDFATCLPYQDTANERSPFRASAHHPSYSVRGARTQTKTGTVVGSTEGACATVSTAKTDGERSGGGAGPRPGSADELTWVVAGVEDAAVPLPPKYARIVDVYGRAGASEAELLREAMRLA